MTEKLFTGTLNHNQNKNFYIVKLGFTGVYIFLFFAEAVLTCAHNLCFEQKKEKKYHFFIKNYNFYCREIMQHIAWTCLRNVTSSYYFA